MRGSFVLGTGGRFPIVRLSRPVDERNAFRVLKRGAKAPQITDKDLRTLVLRPLSYFTSIRISGIIEVQKEARRSADVYGKKRKAKQT